MIGSRTGSPPPSPTTFPRLTPWGGWLPQLNNRGCTQHRRNLLCLACRAVAASVAALTIRLFLWRRQTLPRVSFSPLFSPNAKPIPTPKATFAAKNVAVAEIEPPFRSVPKWCQGGAARPGRTPHLPTPEMKPLAGSERQGQRRSPSSSTRPPSAHTRSPFCPLTKYGTEFGNTTHLLASMLMPRGVSGAAGLPKHRVPPAGASDPHQVEAHEVISAALPRPVG